MRKLNVKWFLALVIGTAVVAGSVCALHAFQYQRIAAALLWQARRAEEAGKIDPMRHYLERYLEFAPQDVEETAHLGQALAGEHFAASLSAPAGLLPPEQGADSRFEPAGRSAPGREDGPGDRRAQRRPPQSGGAGEERPGGRRSGGARRAGGRLGPPAGGGKEARRGDPVLPPCRQGRPVGREQLRPPGLAAARPGRHSRRTPEEHRRSGSGRPRSRRQQPVVGEGPPDALALPPRVRPAGRARPERPGEAAGGPGGGRGRGRGARPGARGRGRADRQGGRRGAPGEGRPGPPRPGLRLPATGPETAGDAGLPRRVGHGRVRPALAPGHAAPERPEAGGR